MRAQLRGQAARRSGGWMPGSGRIARAADGEAAERTARRIVRARARARMRWRSREGGNGANGWPAIRRCGDRWW
eukprot:scaffold693_cov399-Prasinococcus_capsulatus_cf.AAC.39